MWSSKWLQMIGTLSDVLVAGQGTWLLSVSLPLLEGESGDDVVSSGSGDKNLSAVFRGGLKQRLKGLVCGTIHSCFRVLSRFSHPGHASS